jgi:glucose-6-phosphate isomerase, archaeal
MAEIFPAHVDFDLQTGLSKSTKSIQRYLSDMQGIFADFDAYAFEIGKSDPLIYEFYSMGVSGSEKDVVYGTSITYPGKIGKEYYMTKGHFHKVRDVAEVYYCLRGQGFMMMETLDADTEWRELTPGTAVYIPGGWAHRSVNVHPSDPLITFYASPGNAGHDYAMIEKKGFRKLIIEQNGKPVVVKNLRWDR